MNDTKQALEAVVGAEFIRHMEIALNGLRGALIRNPQQAQELLPVCHHIEMAMRTLNNDQPANH